jgi:hypothetical protein
MTDFQMYRGVDKDIYISVYTNTTPPVPAALDEASAKWVAVKEPITGAIAATLTKDTETGGIEITTEPGSSSPVNNTLLIHILDADGTSLDIGTYAHEAQITLAGEIEVVYPPVGTTASFSVDLSLVAAAGGLQVKEPPTILSTAPATATSGTGWHRKYKDGKK